MEASVLQESMKRAIRKCKEEDDRMMKKKKVDWFSFLTDDILIDILRRVPSVILRCRTKFVCKKWFNMITYKILKDDASFIIQKSSAPHTARQVIIREEKQGLELEEQYFDIPFTGRIKSWCNEFLVLVNHRRKEYLYLFNLITNEGLYLPRCRAPCRGHYTDRCGVALSFDGFKGVYKAVHLYVGRQITCNIITFERDITSPVSSMWNDIKVPYDDLGERQYYWGNPVSVQGRYIQWKVYSSHYLLSIDIVKEKISQIPLPKCIEGVSRYHLVEMGGRLAFLDRVSWNHADLWILNDFKRKKWEKLQSIMGPNDVKTEIYPCFYFAAPICSVISKKHLIFRTSGLNIPCLFSCDLANQVMRVLNVCYEGSDYCVVHSTAPSFL